MSRATARIYFSIVVMPPGRHGLRFQIIGHAGLVLQANDAAFSPPSPDKNCPT